ncbi:hypothetical protein FQR65_LT01858 [Abscondita terminalis]|nr:hypothetical protein FQR65_LT01858 [Abscondita terminalis]
MDTASFALMLSLILLLYHVGCLDAKGPLKKESIDTSLQIIHDVATRSLGSLCVTEKFRSLSVPLDTARFEPARQKADLAATLLQDLGVARHNGEYHNKNYHIDVKGNEIQRL